MESLIIRITKNLKITKRNLLLSGLAMSVFFIIFLVLNWIHIDKIHLNPLNQFSVGATLNAFEDLILVIAGYLVVSVIPHMIFTKLLLFIEVTMMLGGISYTILALSSGNLLTCILRLIRQLDYIILIYMLSLVSIQTIYNNRFQNYDNYFIRWCSSLNASLSKKWIKLVFLVLVYWVTSTLTLPY
ncbi:hypothetical protein ACFQ44_13765 [Levilactobacillus lanxiensis]|uniref:Uncharacterized protein n=1 Tax=Levilactobacillus lanxiensis TaxID=2799568 RepID=A0ABW4D815_9LACO